MNSNVSLSAIKMTSREIADMTGKDHFHVMRDIRAMLLELSLADRGYIQNWRHPQNGQSYKEFALPKDLTITLVSGYSVAVRYRIIQRWQQLEEANATPVIPSTLPEALRLAADEAEKRAQAEAQLAIAKPKAQALDRIATADGSMCITNAAKVLQVQPKKLFAWLEQNQWTFRTPFASDVRAYRTRIVTGYLEHKVTEIDRPDGSVKISSQVRVTAKGLAKLSEHFSIAEPV